MQVEAWLHSSGQLPADFSVILDLIAVVVLSARAW